jgi:hypothetical protein
MGALRRGRGIECLLAKRETEESLTLTMTIFSFDVSSIPEWINGLAPTCNFDLDIYQTLISNLRNVQGRCSRYFAATSHCSEPDRESQITNPFLDRRCDGQGTVNLKLDEFADTINRASTPYAKSGRSGCNTDFEKILDDVRNERRCGVNAIRSRSP